MKIVSLKQYLRITGRGAAGVAGALLLYVLSSGPVAGWVVGTVAGQSANALDSALYDARLRRYFDFYGPLLSWRWRMALCVSGKIEGLWEKYEELFCQPQRLADGRIVFTIFEPDACKLSQPAVAKWLPETAAACGLTLHPGAVAYQLPLNSRLLVVLASEDADCWTGRWTTGRVATRQ